ncbi:MAG: hypothetical protein IPM69_06605 [Ignavibacteria bacterium]|nr:hypothetical protein [Ignavibacteria bacterium]
MNHPEELFIPIIAILATFGIPGFVVWKFIEARNRERMAIIDKGMSAEDIRELFHQERRERKNPNPLASLKWGLLVFFVGIGWLIGDMISERIYNPYEPTRAGYNTHDLTVATVFICGGLGLLIFYLIAAKKDRSDKLEQAITQTSHRE